MTGITDDMIEKAARAYAKLEGHDYDTASTGNRMAFYGAAGAILEAALAGRVVVDLPETGTNGFGDPICEVDQVVVRANGSYVWVGAQRVQVHSAVGLASAILAVTSGGVGGDPQ